MTTNKAIAYFEAQHMENRITQFECPTATVEQAAKAVNTSEAQIAKSITFLVEEKPVLVVMCGDVKTDNAKFKAYFHTKASMLMRERVGELIGHEVGGVCPFALNKGVEVYLDESLKRFDYVYAACGSSDTVIRLTVEELENHSGYKEWIDVSKLI